MGGVGRRHAARAVLVPRRRARSPRSPGAPSACTAVASLAAAPARPRRPALRRAAPGAAGRRAARPPLRGRRAAARTLAPRPGTGGASRHRSAARRRRELTKREGLSSRGLVLAVAFGCSRPRSGQRLAPSRSRGRDRRRGRAPVADLGAQARHRRRGADVAVRQRAARSIARSTRSGSRSTSSSNERWSVRPFVATIARRGGVRLGRPAAGRFRRARPRARLLRGRRR